MRQVIVNASKRFEITLTDNQGDFVTGETINYEVRNSLTNALEDSGTMTESPSGLYYFDFTFTSAGQYRILYETPNGYSNEIEKIDVVVAPANADDVTNIISEIDDNEAKLDIIDANVDAIKAKTDNLPADPTSETNATSNTNDIISEIDDNETKLDSIITFLSTLVSDIWSFATRTLTGIGTSGIASEANATTNKTDIIAEIDANEVKIDALPTATEIADQVWDEPLADHLGAGTTGEALDDADATADPQAVAEAVWEFNETGTGRTLTEGTRDAEIDAIKAKTDNLPVDPTSETNATANKDEIIAEVDENESKLDSIILTLSTIVADIWAYVTRTLTGIGTSGIASEANATTNKNEVIAEVDANEVKIDAIKAKTDNLPADPTSETNATANKDEVISEINDNETKIDSLSAQVTSAESNIISEIDANETKLDSILTFLSTLISGIWSHVTRTLTGIGTSGIASEANATTNKNQVIAEVDANETKIDALSTQLTNTEANIVSEIDENEAKLDAIAIQITNAEGTIIGEINANEVKINTVQTTLNTMNQKLISIAGLVHDNSEVVNHVYDSNGKLTQATIRAYANVADLQNQINVVRQYKLIATFNGSGLNTSFRLEREI